MTDSYVSASRNILIAKPPVTSDARFYFQDMQSGTGPLDGPRPFVSTARTRTYIMRTGETKRTLSPEVSEAMETRKRQQQATSVLSQHKQWLAEYDAAQKAARAAKAAENAAEAERIKKRQQKKRRRSRNRSLRPGWAMTAEEVAAEKQKQEQKQEDDEFIELMKFTDSLTEMALSKDAEISIALEQIQTRLDELKKEKESLDNTETEIETAEPIDAPSVEQEDSAERLQRKIEEHKERIRKASLAMETQLPPPNSEIDAHKLRLLESGWNPSSRAERLGFKHHHPSVHARAALEEVPDAQEETQPRKPINVHVLPYLYRCSSI